MWWLHYEPKDFLTAKKQAAFKIISPQKIMQKYNPMLML